MQKVKYIGASDERILTEADMATIDVEHPGLWFNTKGQVEELDDEVAEALVRNFRNDFAIDTEVEDLVAEKSRDDLAEEAKLLGIKGTSKMNKDELAEAIVEREAELQAGIKDGEPSGDASESLEPHA